MALLTDSDRDILRSELAAITAPIRLVFFTQTIGCDTCVQTRRLLDEIASLSDQITVEEHNLILDKESAAQYGVDRAPAIVIIGAGEARIRFVGAPAGYEFMSLVDAILLASSADAGFSDESRELIATVDKPLAIQVFVTPT